MLLYLRSINILLSRPIYAQKVNMLQCKRSNHNYGNKSNNNSNNNTNFNYIKSLGNKSMV